MKTRFLVLLALALNGPALPALATTLVPMSVEQLAHTARAVVRGRVIKQESGWNANRTQMLTFTTIAVLETMKGNPPRELVVEQPGGQMGNTRVYVAGTVTFQLLTDYVLFLEPSKTEPSHYRVVGMAQGAYQIRRDTRTRMEYVVPPFREAFQETVPGESAAGRKARAPAIPLSQFRQQVERSLSQPLYVPRGTTFSVAIRALESRGVGRMQVRGETISDVFPSAGVVIPAGSAIEGTAQRVSGRWLIRWTDLNVGDTHIQIAATSEEMTEGSLRGRTLVVKVK
jgi:hypothetical protein